jgi:hypothetical protein
MYAHSHIAWKAASHSGEKKRAVTEEENEPHRSGKLSSLLWELGHTVTIASGMVVFLTLLVFLLGRPWHLQERIDQILPDRWFKELSDSGVPEELEKLRTKASEELRNRSTGSKTAPAESMLFGLGATKTEVLNIQGRPDQAEDSVWHYGASDIYFAQGRVIGWRVTPSNPLRVR